MTSPEWLSGPQRDDDRGAGRLVQVAGRFRAAWTGPGEPDTCSAELLPVRLTRACCDVLPVDGAGLSLFVSGFRVPIGASDDDASIAERLQFTLGEGPCLSAFEQQRPLVADGERMRRSWPLYAAELLTRTPYRAVTTLPLGVGRSARGALDLYFIDADGVNAVSLVDVSIVIEQITAALLAARATTSDPPQAFISDMPLPPWLTGPATRDRITVWVATGILMAHFDIPAANALALLRAHAYSRGALLDDLAAELVSGEHDPAELGP